MSEIENYIEKTHALARFKTLLPDGDYAYTIVDNPRMRNDKPKFFRVSVPRKGTTFNLIEEAEEIGLYVSDVWQHDADMEEGRLMIKLEERDDGEDVHVDPITENASAL